MALMNRKLNRNVETVFMMTSSRYSFLSSSLIKEVVKFGGCVKDLVPEHVLKKLLEKYR
jgi:pantetheine-phosphate adenylyltransferase